MAEYFDVATVHLEKISPLITVVWGPAMNKRVGLNNSTLDEVYFKAN